MIITEDLQLKRVGVENTPIGFNASYSSFVNYILDITEQIWEKRAVWVLFDCYDPDIEIEHGALSITGRDTVIMNTLETLYSFPDRTMKGEAVIWARYEDGSTNNTLHTKESDERRYFSSHRILSTATNLGATRWGKASQKSISFRSIADCLAKDNLIYKEWLVRDNLNIIKQLGFDALALAKKDTRYQGLELPSPSAMGRRGIEFRQNSAYSEAVDLVLGLVEDIWFKKDYKRLGNYYHTDALSHGICNAEARTSEQRQAMFESVFSSFTDRYIQLDQITCTQSEEGSELALRWRLQALHTNAGFFGSATASSINMLGINHYYIKDKKIVHEHMIYDAFDVLCQMHRENT